MPPILKKARAKGRPASENPLCATVFARVDLDTFRRLGAAATRRQARSGRISQADTLRELLIAALDRDERKIK